MSRNVRIAALTITSALAFIALVSTRRTSPDALTEEEQWHLEQRLLSRVKRDGPNHAHMLRLAQYAPRFAKAEGANESIVRAAALLHDSTKEDGTGEPKERFCTHGTQAAAWATSVLREFRKSDAFVSAVSSAIEQHMGPCGSNSEGQTRFMTKFCQRTYPAPVSVEARVLYDLDMLDLMTVEGVVKVVELRQRNAEFAREPVKDSALTGSDSAWKSVNDANETLLTVTARACGGELVAHSRAFLDGIDWDQVRDVETFKAAAHDFLVRHPRPECLR